jgi:hypothetical protein
MGLSHEAIAAIIKMASDEYSLEKKSESPVLCNTGQLKYGIASLPKML